MFDRDKYFDLIRASLFGAMDQTQVNGQRVILMAWEIARPCDDLRHLAYMLATTYHETAATMWPIEEYGKGQGHDYGVPDPETGQTYFGRGFVQLTWRENYSRAAEELHLRGTPADIEYYAERALDVLIASLIMFRGMTYGWFTGKKLNSYFSLDSDDPVGARYIINGQDQAEKIAGYHSDFLAACKAAWTQQPAPPVKPVVKVGVHSDPGVGIELWSNGVLVFGK